MKEGPVKSLGQWYAGRQSDKSRGFGYHGVGENGLDAIDQTILSGNCMIQRLQYSLYPRLPWPLTM